MIDQLLTTTAIHFVEQGPQEAFFGFLLGAALSIGGALLNKPKAPPAPPPPPAPTPAPAPQIVQVVETKTTPNIQEGVDAAVDAGFNPTTAARLGLIQQFVTNQTPFLTTNPKFVRWQNEQNYSNALYNRQLQIQQDQYNYQQQKRSWTSNLVSGLGGAVTGFVNNRANSVRTGLQNDLLRSEIYRNNSIGYTNFNPVNSVISGSKSEYYSPQDTTQPLIMASDPVGNIAYPSAEIKSTNVFGLNNYDNTSPDAEQAESGYAEIVSNLYGVSKITRDVVRHFGGSKYGQYFDATNNPNYNLIDSNRVVRSSGFQEARALTEAGHPLSFSAGGGW